MNAQLPPEPPRYSIDEETKNLLTQTIEYAVQVARLQTDDQAQLEIRELIDEVCERFELITEQTEYDIEELENGDIYWHLLGSKDKKDKPHMTLVTDNTNVTQFPGKHNDSDS
jgi:predicted O-linked N-acetylglucosamine transferase (SPINDLY family)